MRLDGRAGKGAGRALCVLCKAGKGLEPLWGAAGVSGHQYFTSSEGGALWKLVHGAEAEETRPRQEGSGPSGRTAGAGWANTWGPGKLAGLDRPPAQRGEGERGGLSSPENGPVSTQRGSGV